MAYAYKNSKGQEYFLHTSNVTLKGGHQRAIYFFSKTVKETGSLDALPAGYIVSENSRTGLPLLKKDVPATPAA
jgi:hypothetical protein